MGTTYQDLQETAERAHGAREAHDHAVRVASYGLQSEVSDILKMGSTHTGTSFAPKERLSIADPTFDHDKRFHRSSATLRVFPNNKEVAVSVGFAYRVIRGVLVFAFEGEENEAFPVEGRTPDFARKLVEAFEKKIAEYYSFG
jgi:hypothetical protein